MNTEQAVKAFCTNPTEETTASLCTVLSELSGSQVVFCTVPNEQPSEAVPSETVPEGEAVTEGGAA